MNERFESPRRLQLCCLSLAVAGALVLMGSWSAPFLAYDDTVHISGNPELAPEVPLFEYFKAKNDRAYIPLTMLSWRLDRRLFSGWMPDVLGSWAPGTRTVNWFFHVSAALLLWQLLQGLGLSHRESYFVALVFALHPTACESVSWATERKNVLAAFFGFAALWCWVRFDPLKATAEPSPRAEQLKKSSQENGISLSPKMRMAGAAALYTMALMSKQSALGLFPLFCVIEGINGVRAWMRNRKDPATPALMGWSKRALALLPLAAITPVFIALGIKGHGKWMAPPPGGSMFTSLLTDTWIIVRYFENLLAPTRLSAAYGIEPIVSLGSARLWCALGVVLAVITGSIFVARSRTRAILGWLWFFGALGPSLNLVALPFVMTDRYLYLALPGFFIVVVESVQGLAARLRSGADREDTSESASFWGLPTVAFVFLIWLSVFSVHRSFIWRDTYTLFSDAVAQEPRSAYARYGLAQMHGMTWQVAQAKPDAESKARARTQMALRIKQLEAMFECVDVDRQLNRSEVAFELGEHFRIRGQPAKARRYYEEARRRVQGVAEDPELIEKAEIRIEAMGLGPR